ncbi:hypothetical protein [Lihuaxuella thermophila]|uniref:Uncharacterized protein n=1 Tax=Lihuaxuella thermophila TaxID=1173111 RepID=A0A1H8BFF1_9BACL|nr:hypothetical protein [Lihuaxuella thermophila]SEM81486.1 hypothetical protein SAMN05444955_102153 [Lihuaxuella thermophila]
MIIPFAARLKKAAALSDVSTGSFVFLKTLNEKLIIIPLIDAQIETRDHQLIISGKSISGKKRERRENGLKAGCEAPGNEAKQKHPRGGNLGGEQKK